MHNAGGKEHHRILLANLGDKGGVLKATIAGAVAAIGEALAQAHAP